MSPEDELTKELRGTCEAAWQRSCVATYFLQMLQEHGGVETAKKLLAKSEPPAGLFELGMIYCFSLLPDLTGLIIL